MKGRISIAAFIFVLLFPLYLSAQPIAAFPPVDGSPGEKLGRSIACLRDFGGSLASDIALGVPGALGGDGKVGILSGANGSSLVPSPSGGAGDELGFSVGYVGDLGNDGREDIIIGVPGTNLGEFGSCASDGAAALFFSDDPSSLVPICPPSTLVTKRFGHAVAGLLDDIDDGFGGGPDGLNELIVSDPLYDTGSPVNVNAGLVAVMEGGGTESIFAFEGNQPNANLGYSAVSIGDQDGDGKRDVLAGAPGAGGNMGYVQVLSTDTSAGDSNIQIILGDGRLGASVSTVGDVNGDGREDFIVGAPEADQNGSNSGQVRLYSLPVNGSADFELLCYLDGPGPGSRFGESVQGLGDVNGDGNLDFAVGAPGADGDIGRAFVISAIDGLDFIGDPNNDDDDDDNGFPGGSGICHVAFEMRGTVPGEMFGISLAGRPPRPSDPAVCDFNNDGLADWGIGSRLNSQQQAMSGAALFMNGVRTPSSVNLVSKIDGNGEFTASLSLNKLPEDVCDTELWARITRKNLSGATAPEKTITRKFFKSEGTKTSFKVKGLPLVKKDAGGEPFSFHLIAATFCTGTPIFSNIDAQSLGGCGVSSSTPVTPAQYLNTLSQKLQAAEGNASTKNLNRCQSKSTSKAKKKCLKKLRVKLKGIRTKFKCSSRKGKKRKRCKKKRGAKLAGAIANSNI